MAEINAPATGSNKPGARRSKKLSTRVDLTPMVDLGFLLITFFIFTTTMSSPKVMKLAMPKDTDDGDLTPIGQSTALTVIPLDANRIFYYHGDLESALKENTYGVTSYSVTDGLGQIIRTKQAALDKTKAGKHEDLMVMIKPTPESNYQNVVNVLDEMLINDVKHYAVLDVTPQEKDVANTKSTSAL
ncbi:ExbD/TolR family protein [Niastella sp. OAS944]|uniref:ExbD/TolR family protein n=1 Tax=Niastella sp. OAS944 TaxID=2664089 RepID=UPI003490AF07|nr:biopolymer transport protein ExbD [Chitinophagaceae bacterium OAS944]